MTDLPRAPHPLMTALSRGVPVTLVADLLEPAGPDSRTIFAMEPGDLGWLRELAYPPAPAGPGRGESAAS